MSDYKPLGFETDLANKNFAGATNPDSLLFVEFYWHEPFDKNKTEDKFLETGIWRPIKMERVVYVRIMKPGDKNTIIEEKIREDHKRRWPDKWLYFQIQNGMIDGGENQPGWKVEEWPELNEEQVHQLKYLRFYTVEQIAGASDSQVQGLGMGGIGLRKKAQDACKERSTAEVRAELNEKDKELASMQAQIDELKKMMFSNHAEPAPVVNAVKQKRKYTRRTSPEAAA